MSDDNYARVVDIKEIENNDFNLNVKLYIEDGTEEASVNVQESQHKVKELEETLKSLNEEVEDLVNEINKKIDTRMYKNTKLGQLPSHWSIVDLYDVRDKSDRYSFAGGPFGSDLKRSDYTEAGVRILQLQNIGDGEFLDKYKIFTSEQKAKQLSKCLIYPGNIIIAKMADPVARACIIPSGEKYYLMASDGIRLSVNKEEYDTNYLKYVINSSYFRKMAVANSTGTTRLRIGLDKLKKLPIIKPPKKEQEEIGLLLTLIDQKRDLVKSIEKELSLLKTGLLQDIFSQKVEIN